MTHAPHSSASGASEDELHAWVDQRLGADLAQALHAQSDADQADTLNAWRDQRDALRGLHSELLDEPVPASLLAAAQRAAAQHARTAQWWRYGGMAASLLLAFGVGWFSHGPWPGQPGQKLAASEQRFAQQAQVAHAVYVPEVKHPVEVAAQQQEHLVQWLSKRLGRPLKVPQLPGYELVGGRLLPGEDGARAQFMFQNPNGERLTLYLGALNAAGALAPASAATHGTGEAARPATSGESAFSYASNGGVPAFYWVDQGFGYALAGKLDRPSLLKLATAVYQQL